MPLSALYNREVNFTCSICMENMVPQSKSEVKAFIQMWSEHPDLINQLQQLAGILKDKPELKDYLSKATLRMFNNQGDDGLIITQRLNAHSDEINEIIKSLIVQKLECHDSEAPQFHSACFRKVLEENRLCPICRNDIDQLDREKFGIIHHKLGSQKIVSSLALAIFCTFLFLARSELGAFLTSGPCIFLFKLACIIALPLSIGLMIQSPGTRLYQVEEFFDNILNMGDRVQESENAERHI